MRQFFSFIPMLLAAAILHAQAPLNDECSGLVHLGIAPACPTTLFTNVQATNSDIGIDNNPTCFQSSLASRDVWFAFTCPTNEIEFRVRVTGAGNKPLTNPQIAIYRGDCVPNGLGMYACKKGDPGVNDLFLDLVGLTPSADYYIRVSDYPTSGVPNAGTFTICVEPIPTITNITAGGSVLCSGTLYDSGGANGNYGKNENHVFKICPSVPTACIEFQLQKYNMEEGDFIDGTGESLAFYDGPDTLSPLITKLTAGDFNGITTGGGGVSFVTTAKSGCMTLHFKSDLFVEFEGFEGSWKCLNTPCSASPNMIVTNDASLQELGQLLAGPSNQVTITDVKCGKDGFGTFRHTTAQTEVGLRTGIVLTTGAAQLATGANDMPNASAINDGSSDQDLAAILNTQEAVFDACVLELDVFTRSDELSFEYVFGSEEYPEFANQEFNDVFAFLVSGPGIVGSAALNNQLNIATLAAGIPVTINNVNHLVNYNYYRNNQLGKSVQYDGLTSDKNGVKKSLTARQKVTPCQTYHLKLAIADRYDDIYDSGVFVSELRPSAPKVEVQFVQGLDYFTESCTGSSDQLLITLAQPAVTPITFQTVIGGTATQGVDYTLNMPSTITFQPGEQQLSFPIVPVNDALVEGNETISISLTNDFGCGPFTYETVTFELRDNIQVTILGGDTLYVCTGDNIQLEATGCTEYTWSPASIMSNPFAPNPVCTPTFSRWVYVRGNVGTCTGVDSAFIVVTNPFIDVTPNGQASICFGSAAGVNLIANNNVGNANLVWSPSQGLNNPNIPNPIANPTKTTTYTASVSLGNCVARDTVKILVDTVMMPILTTRDTLVCQDNPVVLGSAVKGSTVYQWFPSFGLSDPTISNPIATPSTTTTYTLIATSGTGLCKDTAQVIVRVTPSDVQIQGPDTVLVCFPDAVGLRATTSPSGSPIQWAPSFYVSPTSGDMVTVKADESTWIYASATINGCLARDSVRILVDSLPMDMITATPIKPVYCPGDTVYLTSPTYEPANFPRLRSYWPPVAGEETPDSLWNMIIRAQEGSWIYKRFITNGACRDTAQVSVFVETPTTFTITGDLDLCPGETTQLFVTSNPPGAKVEWKEPTNVFLSCSNCPNPTASPLTTTTFTVTGKDVQCPSEAMATVNVWEVPGVVWPDPNRCASDTIVLNRAVDIGQTYFWSGPGITNPTEKYPKVKLSADATYTVTVTNVQGCSRVITATVTVLNPTIDAGVSKLICKGTVANLAATTTGGVPGTITWSPGAGVGANFSPTVNENTVFTATLTFGGTQNCKVQDTVWVRVIDPAITITGDSVLCRGKSTQLLATTTTAGTTFSWGPSTGLSCTNCPNPTATPAATTPYILTYTNPVCTGTIPYPIRVSNIAPISRADTVLCPGLPGVLNASPEPNYTYTWSGPGITNPTAATQSINPVAANSVYSVTITNPDGCSITQTLDVRRATATFSVGPDLRVCFGAFAAPTLTVNPSNIPLGNNVLWAPDIKTTPVTDTILFTGTLTYANNCKISDAFIATPFPKVDVVSILIDSAAGRSPYCYGSPLKLTAVTQPTAAAVAWYSGGQKFADGKSAIFNAPFTPGQKDGTAEVQAIATANTNCSDTLSAVYSFESCDGIPNAFTPGGQDTINNTFGLVLKGGRTTDIKVEQFRIYNRWGQKIWEATPTISRWDGKHNGTDAPSDMYIYHIVLVYPGGTIQRVTGEVTLLR